ncbi:MAG: transporter substrate-binding domain-containing protein [Pseudonocardiaceae bacterium]|nr:transporter substrate-binding domain-containing protein [Pseudonocardiaceae bacterium]
MAEPPARQHWPDLPAEQRPVPGARLWRTLRGLRRRGVLTVRRIGCALLVLLVVVVAGLVLLDRTIDGITALFGDEPEPVPGNTFDSVTPSTTASSGSENIDRITRRDRLIVGVQRVPGLVERDPQTRAYSGFDIALAGLVARELGVDPADTAFKTLPGGYRESVLATGEADLVLGGYAITEQRSADVAFAGPYLRSPQRLAVPAGRAGELDPLRDGTVCAVEDSPTALSLAPRLGERLVTRGSLDTCAALLGNRVDALAGDEVLLAGVLADDPELQLSGAPLGETRYGIGLAPGDDVLARRVREVLRTAVEDGTWARLYAEHLGTPVPEPPPLNG